MATYVLRYRAEDADEMLRLTVPFLGTAHGVPPGTVSRRRTPTQLEFRSSDRKFMRQLWRLTRPYVQDHLLLDDDD